jgi:hypothetical protein
MRIFTLAAFAAAAAAVSLVVLAQGSNLPTKACGTWTFSGQGHTNGGADANLRFNFTPTQQKCGVDPCMCHNIAYIQVIRVRDMDNSRYIQPFKAQEQRMVVSETPELNGWAVDRLSSNAKVGYFKGITIDPILFSSDIELGSNAATPKVRAKMEDTPERYPRRIRFEAVSVPVCLDTNGACGNKLLGFRTWKFRVQDNLHGTKPTHAASTHWERLAAQAAIDKWNQKVGATLQPFPDGTEPLSEE